MTLQIQNVSIGLKLEEAAAGSNEGIQAEGKEPIDEKMKGMREKVSVSLFPQEEPEWKESHMNKKDIDQQLSVMLQLAKRLSEVPIPVVRYRAEMIVGLLQELMETVVDET